MVENIGMSHVRTAQISITKMETQSSRGSSGYTASDTQKDERGRTNMHRGTWVETKMGDFLRHLKSLLGFR